MKILHLINSLTQGGAETLLAESITRLSRNYPSLKHNIITLTDKGYYFDVLSDEHRYKHVPLTKFNFLSVISQIRKFIKKENIDIVHAHLYEASIIARLAAPRHVKVINTYHSALHFYEYRRKRLLLDKFTLSKTDHLIFVSGSIAEKNLEKLKYHGKYSVIYNFCSDEIRPLFQNRNTNILKIITLGNLKDVKNHHLLLDAIICFRKKYHSDIYADIYGEGPLHKVLQDRIAAENLNVTLKGFIKVNTALFEGYDLFLLPSRHEGMPLSLIEAMTYGMPSLLNDIPELRETAEDAALYFKRDSAEDMADKMFELLSDPSLREVLSSRAKSVSAKYNIDLYCESVYKIYENTDI